MVARPLGFCNVEVVGTILGAGSDLGAGARTLRTPAGQGCAQEVHRHAWRRDPVPPKSPKARSRLPSDLEVFSEPRDEERMSTSVDVAGRYADCSTKSSTSANLLGTSPAWRQKVCLGLLPSRVFDGSDVVREPDRPVASCAVHPPWRATGIGVGSVAAPLEVGRRLWRPLRDSVFAPRPCDVIEIHGAWAKLSRSGSAEVLERDYARVTVSGVHYLFRSEHLTKASGLPGVTMRSIQEISAEERDALAHDPFLTSPRTIWAWRIPGHETCGSRRGLANSSAERRGWLIGFFLPMRRRKQDVG